MMNRKVFIALFVLFAAVVVIALCMIYGAYGEDMDGYYVLCCPGSVVNVRNRPKADAYVVG